MNFIYGWDAFTCEDASIVVAVPYYLDDREGRMNFIYGRHFYMSHTWRHAIHFRRWHGPYYLYDGEGFLAPFFFSHLYFLWPDNFQIKISSFLSFLVSKSIPWNAVGIFAVNGKRSATVIFINGSDFGRHRRRRRRPGTGWMITGPINCQMSTATGDTIRFV